jgi:heme-degrading monooxygenase HmoA
MQYAQRKTLFTVSQSRCQMIIREWRGHAATLNADAYPNHFRTNVVPELRTVAGFMGAYLSQRQLNDKIEYLVLTCWQSMEAIRGFTGDDVSRAVVEPQAVAALIEFDATVQHYEVIENV